MSEADFNEAARKYAETLPKLQELERQKDEWMDRFNTQFKPVQNTLGTQKRFFKKWMKQRNLNELVVAGTTFTFEVEPKVLLTMERVESSFPPDAVQRFKSANAISKDKFKEER
jgi:hypothetical protein